MPPLFTQPATDLRFAACDPTSSLSFGPAGSVASAKPRDTAPFTFSPLEKIPVAHRTRLDDEHSRKTACGQPQLTNKLFTPYSQVIHRLFTMLGCAVVFLFCANSPSPGENNL